MSASWPEAVDILARALGRCATESVPTLDAVGRVLAEDAPLRGPMPPHAVSAMDGYAVRARDAGRTVNVVAQSRPGGALPAELPHGAAVRVGTGAPLPPGADVVVPQEDVQGAHTRRVTLPAPLAPGRHVVPAGADVPPGAVLRAGTLVRPATLATLLDSSVDLVRVPRRPVVRVLPVGDELLHARADSNGPAVADILARTGAEVARLKALPDDVAALADALDAPADLHVTIGGTSVGDHDVARRLASASGDMLLDSVAVRPGRPVLLQRRRGLWLALPGNPAAALLLARALVAPVLRRAQGRPGEDPSTALHARTADRIEAAADRTTLHPVRIASDGVHVVRGASHGSTAWFAHTDGIVVAPPGAGIAAGSAVEVLLW